MKEGVDWNRIRMNGRRLAPRAVLKTTKLSKCNVEEVNDDGP